MPKSSNKLGRIVLLAVSTAAVTVAVCALIARPWQTSAGWSPEKLDQFAKDTAPDIEKEGIMSAADYLHWWDLDKEAKKSGALSDSDVDWLIAHAKPLDPKRPLIAGLAERMAATPIDDAQTLTPPQEAKVYAAFASLSSSREVSARIVFATLMSKLKDPRAVPKLTALLKDKSNTVRQDAKTALAAIPAVAVK